MTITTIDVVRSVFRLRPNKANTSQLRRTNLLLFYINDLLLSQSREMKGLCELTVDVDRVLREMVSDGVIHWGRIIASLAYAKCLFDKCGSSVDSPFAQEVAEIFDNRVGDWIKNEGGWEDVMSD